MSSDVTWKDILFFCSALLAKREVVEEILGYHRVYLYGGHCCPALQWGWLLVAETAPSGVLYPIDLKTIFDWASSALPGHPLQMMSWVVVAGVV